VTSVATTAATVSEGAFQRALLLALGRRPDLRLWRQNVGAVAVRGEEGSVARFFRAGPPKGAADLSGIVRPEGYRLEIEVKASRGRPSHAQSRWASFIAAFGGIYLLAAYNGAQSLQENVRRVVLSLDEALRLRRSVG
jgi:hypothetical protein